MAQFVLKIMAPGPRDIESCHLAAARGVKLWSLNANLSFKEPYQLTKFTEGSLKQYLAEIISLQKSNCNIFGLIDSVALFANEARFSDFGCSYGHVLSKTKSGVLRERRKINAKFSFI